ncbi:MAG TPA: helix-turn-helix transcriptional regulator [Patescibacteria group bacterium]|jgi:transcriptional regulator with XRE-family HTH domain|nr:helix-turn-helix transcriptional regulator [Patescibacteria group bacterium]
MPKRVRRDPEFGDWLKRSRSQAGKSQLEAAQELSIKQPYWSKIEIQGLIPPDDVLEKICIYLGRPLEEIESFLSSTPRTKFGFIIPTKEDNILPLLKGLVFYYKNSVSLDHVIDDLSFLNTQQIRLGGELSAELIIQLLEHRALQQK